MGLQIPAYVNDVVAVEIEDKPGSLARCSNRSPTPASTSCSCMPSSVFIGQSRHDFRFSDNDKAVEVLQASGVKLLDAESFGILETES